MFRSSPVPGTLAEVAAASAKARALVVDDDDPIRNLTVHILRRDGFAVSEAVNGRDAIQFLAASGGTFDVIVLDLAMPEVTGTEVIEYLRTNAPDLLGRVVIITANIQAFRACLPEGTCQILLKPFDLSQFLAAVRACMRAT